MRRRADISFAALFDTLAAEQERLVRQAIKKQTESEIGKHFDEVAND